MLLAARNRIGMWCVSFGLWRGAEGNDRYEHLLSFALQVAA